MNHTYDIDLPIYEVLQQYFEGIFTGNIALLRDTFHPMALLFGDVDGAPYFNPLEDYLDGVKNRKSPFQAGEKNKMEVMAIDVINIIAVAKVHVPTLGLNYYDLLSLNLLVGQWKIVNKLLTHVKI